MAMALAGGHDRWPSNTDPEFVLLIPLMKFNLANNGYSEIPYLFEFGFNPNEGEEEELL